MASIAYTTKVTKLRLLCSELQILQRCNRADRMVDLVSHQESMIALEHEASNQRDIVFVHRLTTCRKKCYLQQ